MTTSFASLTSRQVEIGKVVVRLNEWATLGPDDPGQGRVLRGLSFDDHPAARLVAQELDRIGVVGITERRDGLRIETGSYVGRLQVGPIELTIVPKVSASAWTHLIAFALRLDSIKRQGRVDALVEASGVQEWLILALIEHGRQLITGGLHRDYIERRALLSRPRGRIDFEAIARRGGVRTAQIPCRFITRLDDSPLNRALLAGMQLARQVTRDVGLRSQAHRLIAILKESISLGPASLAMLTRAERDLDRRTRRYEPTLRLVRLLLQGQAIAVDGGTSAEISIPGFAFDMNALWQRLLGRVLSDWAPELGLREELRLRSLFRLNPVMPLRRGTPMPRPDFAIRRGQAVTYLDAKYRDLWNKSLPREMLYQLSMYAFAQGTGTAAMLYPTDTTNAMEQRVDLWSPLSSRTDVSVGLRPVHLRTLAALIAEPPTSGREDRRRAFAMALATGCDTSA